MPATKYSLGLAGQLHFLKAAIEAQKESIESFYEIPDWEYANEYFDNLPTLHINKKLTAIAGTTAVGVVFAFIGTCFAKKIFDEFYNRTLNRPIGKYIDLILAKMQLQENKYIEYRDIIYLQDLNVTIAIRVLVDPKKTDDINHQLSEAIRLAYSYLEKNGRKAPIHSHLIIDGKVKPDPEFYISIKHLEQAGDINILASHQFLNT